jgi:serine phosphatase RsbU (regulator of sigma subunit)
MAASGVWSSFIVVSTFLPIPLYPYKIGVAVAPTQYIDNMYALETIWPRAVAILFAPPHLPSALAFFIQAIPAQPPLPTSAALRWEFANLAAGVALLAAALAGAAIFFFRRRAREYTLIYFSIFCALYAVRLLATRSTFRDLFNTPTGFWRYLIWDITAVIILPVGLFLYQVLSPRLKMRLLWLLILQGAFGVFGILGPFIGISFATLNRANNYMVLGSFLALGVGLVLVAREPGPRKQITPELRVFTAGFIIWALFIFQANLLGLGIISGTNMEFIGFTIFVAGLAYIAARRTFDNEQRLAAIDSELEVARRIQSSTLPQSTPALPGLEIAARYVPMSAVAGDFYDFLLIDDRRLGILVADVTGHGVPAALIATMLKIAFAGQAPHASDPARMLTELNRALCGKFEEHFVTAAYLFVDLDKNLLRYSAAAHPPLLLLSHVADHAREIEENGLMLGMFPDATYTSVEIPFSPGDRVLLYTDGLFEAHNSQHEEFGRARCKEFLESSRSLPASQFVTDILARVSSFSSPSSRNSSTSQHDDITLLLLNFLS